jgi:hypothetical protein
MSFTLTFDHTGDTIPFEPVNQEVLEFYIDQLNQQSLNGFFPVDQQYGAKILQRINELNSCILKLNNYLCTFVDIKFNTYSTEDYLNQDVLNELHSSWANSQLMLYDIQKQREHFNFSGVVEQLHAMFPDNIPTPALGTVLSKLNLLDTYNTLNVPGIHELEKMFNSVRYTVSKTWTKLSDNPFSKSVLSNDRANLKMSFDHLGRSLYEKFCYFDMDLKHNDENSYNEFLGYVTLSLTPSQTIPLSKEYVQWCQQHNRKPIGNFLNIGNIPDLYENLTKYRIIVFRNLLSNNRFSIHKTKG